MGVRNVHTESIDDWRGLNTVDNPENLTPDWWVESSNVIVSAKGSVTPLRSPYTLINTSIGAANIISIFNYINAWPGGVAIIDGDDGNTYQFDTSTIPATATLIRSGQTVLAPWIRLNILNFCYGLNGTEIVQNDSSFNFYKVGIDPPAAAVSPSIVAGGTLTLAVGVTVSYAYRNSVTGHVGKCSPTPSVSSGATTGGNTLRVPVVASGQTGVDGIVLFITKDGGSDRYLVIDANGNPIVYANSTTNIDISAQYILDTNTAETAFNDRPRDDAYFMFQHQGRIFQTNFRTDSRRSQIRFSGKESVGIGVPTEAFPPKNILNVPGRIESAISGASTPVGALFLSDRDGYLLTGQVIDATVSAQQQLQVTPGLQEMKWGLGTYSPRSLRVTPYGCIWLDQYRCIQLWPYSGRPTEVGLPLRSSLSDLFGAPAALANVDAAWVKTPEQQYYVLVGNLAGSSSYRMYIIGFYEDPTSRELEITYAISDIDAHSVAQTTNTDAFTGTLRCMIGSQVLGSSVVQQILNPTQRGSGWLTSQSLYFTVMTGGFKTNGNFNHLHSVRYDCNSRLVTVQTRQMNDGMIETHPTEVDDLSNFAMIDRYGPHKKMKFIFPKDDLNNIELTNMRITYSAKGRAL